MVPMRRRRRRNGFRQKTNVNFTGIIVIISIAVLLGYGTAKFVIYPIFNQSDGTVQSSVNLQTATGSGVTVNPQNGGSVADNGGVQQNTGVPQSADSRSFLEKILSLFSNDGEGSADGQSGQLVPQDGSVAPQDPSQIPQAQQPQQVQPNGNATIVDDQLNVTNTNAAAQTTQSGYCIQFGSFSARNSAETLVGELKNSGITAEIIEKDGNFKVVSQIFQQKEQAVATMNSLDSGKFSDAFVTPR